MKKILAVALGVMVLAGCDNQADRAKELTQSEVKSQSDHLQNVKFHDVQFFARENNGGMVCGKYSDGSGADHRFMSAIYSQESVMKVTKPFIEGESTTSDIMNTLWESECK